MRPARSIPLLVLLGAAACRGDMPAPPASGQRDASIHDRAELAGGAGDPGGGSVTDPPPTEDCLAAWAVAEEAGAPLTAVDAPFSAQMGAFVVDVDSGGGVALRHPRSTARGVYGSLPGAPPIAAARTELHATDSQGSFALERVTSWSCEGARLLSASIGAPGVSLEGDFLDGGACSDAHWRLQLCESRAGQAMFLLTTDDPRLDELSLVMSSSSDERVFGVGEQFTRDTLNLKGRAIDVIAQEGGVGRGHQPISGLVNVYAPGSAGDEASTYAPMPHFLTSTMRSVLLDNTEVARFDFTRPEAHVVSVHAARMSGRFFAGQTPKELLERTTEVTGRMPELPSWVDDGAIVALARDTARSLELLDALEDHGARVAAVWNQTWSGKVTTQFGEQVFWNWVQNPTTHPEWDGFVDALEERGVRTLCYVNPMLVDAPDNAPPAPRHLLSEARANHYLVEDEAGEELRLPVTAFEVGLLDVTNPDARTWFKEILREELVENARCSGWMADFAEALPFEARLHSGADAASFHNAYPVEWMRLNREAVEEMGGLGELLVFNRSGHTLTPSVSLLLWEGDQLTTWDKYDGMVSALHGLIGGGLSGLALNHSDTGGYTSLSVQGIFGYEREEELLLRWTEMNAFTAVLRTHEGNQPDVNAQVYSNDRTLDHFARFTRVYRALAPIRREAMREARDHGWPLARHVWLEYPDDAVALDVHDEFMLGSDVLVAPIKNKCWTWPFCPYDKAVYLPADEWVHLWSGETYFSDGASFTVAAPIGEPAVFVRAASPFGEELRVRLRAEGIDVPDPWTP